jgi:hypothetical protein
MGWTFWFLRQVLRLRGRNRQAPERTLGLGESRVNQLLRYAADRSPFYRERFQGIDLQHCRLSDLPPLSKAEAMDRFDALVTDRRITRAGVGSGWSSASTRRGKPRGSTPFTPSATSSG